MAILNVNPTRAQLRILQNRLKIAKSGYKMLKDKTDEIIKRYSTILKSSVKQMEILQKEFLSIQQFFATCSAFTSISSLETIFCGEECSLNFGLEKFLNLSIPNCKIQQSSNLPYSYIDTSPQVDILAQKMQNFMPLLCKVASQTKTLNMLLVEIERNKRRVNALEFILIPNLEQTIKYIKFKLEENERASTTRLLKLKDILKSDRGGL